jgi:2-polyprenyl-3-methyl-5-hydroxy-6-metoxy-1,4-benzoquinol methylase
MQSYVDKSDNYFSHARKEIEPLLPLHCGRVLEIGCGSGATLGWLRQSGRTSHTVGVEIAQTAANSARANVDEVHCLDFEINELPAPRTKFDVIFCLDVLEHMVDPWAVVDRLVTRYLDNNGHLVVSLPNIRHYSVVLPLLLQGKWTYEAEGLLDRTHLRFFTRETAFKLLSHPMLDSIRQADMRARWGLRRKIFSTLTAGVFNDFVTYQYYLASRKIAVSK